jgi:Gamma-glutamyl cyclotransferase, AIG2-like
MDPMLYFAYGSNMNWNQIRSRCPSAQFAFVAKAEGYALAFTRFSQNRKCGVADIVASSDNDVWGVIFDIPNDEIGQLDKSEGYRPERALRGGARSLAVIAVWCQARRPACWLLRLYSGVRTRGQPISLLSLQTYRRAALSH